MAPRAYSPGRISAGLVVLGAGVGCLVFAVVGSGEPAPEAGNVITSTLDDIGQLTPSPFTGPTAAPTPSKAKSNAESNAKSNAESNAKSGAVTPTEKAAPRQTSKPADSNTAPAPEASTPKVQKTKTTPKAAAPAVNVAAGGEVRADGHTQDYVATNVTDGDVNTYWEAAAGFPKTLTVDLGRQQTVGRLVLSLPPMPDWNSRTQTIAFEGSRNGTSFSSVKGAGAFTFDANASSLNQVSVIVPESRARYLRLTFSANSGWPSAQLSELEVHSS